MSSKEFYVFCCDGAYTILNSEEADWFKTNEIGAAIFHSILEHESIDITAKTA